MRSVDNFCGRREDMSRRGQNEFRESYEKYKAEVERMSGGLVETSMADFVKMSAFHTSTIEPVLSENSERIYEHIQSVVKIVSRY